MNYSLTSFLQTVEDFRRPQGQRYPLDKVLLMIVMSIINGASGYREMSRFMEHHQSNLEKLLNLKHGVPSHVSIREILLGIDLEAFNKSFLKWMESELDKPEQKWVSMDGKAIRSTIKKADNKLKDFVQVVSIFTHNSELVIGQKSFMNKKGIEPECVRQLIQQLDKSGIYICLDALHCKKKL